MSTTEETLNLPTVEELSELSALVEEWRDTDAAIARAEQELEELKADKAKIETDLIPSMMAQAGGVEKLTLADGTTVALRDELYASVKETNRLAAFAWLEEHGHGDVIKDQLTISLGKGATAKARAEALIAKAEAEGITDYSRKRAVAPNTLQALLKEQLAEGVDVPKETFGVFQQRRAVIKLVKGAK